MGFEVEFNFTTIRVRVRDPLSINEYNRWVFYLQEFSSRQCPSSLSNMFGYDIPGGERRQSVSEGPDFGDWVEPRAQHMIHGGPKPVLSIHETHGNKNKLVLGIIGFVIQRLEVAGRPPTNHHRYLPPP